MNYPQLDFTALGLGALALIWSYYKTPKGRKGFFSSNRPSQRVSKGEGICKQYLESVFKQPFTKERPDFLFYLPTGRNLELDMYNPKLNIACEYNGQQHYKFTKAFHHTIKDFKDQYKRDQFKIKRCKELKINLILVPYTVKHENIPSYLASQLNLIRQGVYLERAQTLRDEEFEAAEQKRLASKAQRSKRS